MGIESKIFAKGVIGNVRKAQEDSHGYKLGTPNGDLFVVCDGMGGHVGGAMASKIAVESIIDYIGKEPYVSPLEALDGALQFANMQILGYTTDHPELKGMGTTACIVLIQGNDVWIAHVGDSRIYLYLGNERQLHRITKDHSYVQTLVDAGEITDEEAEHHPNKNRIMKALGIKPELHPTFNFGNKPIHPKNGDVFLICSDGLSGMIPDSTISRTMGESMDLQQKGERLIELAMIGETVQPGGQDNCTLEMIEVDNSPWTTSEFMSYNPKPVVQQTPANPAPTPSSPKPEAPNPAKPQPKLKGRTLRFVAIALATLIVISVLTIILSPTIYSYKIEKDRKKITELQRNVEEMKKKLDDANTEWNKAKATYNRYENTPQSEGYRNALNGHKKIYNNLQKEYNKAVQNGNKEINKFNEEVNNYNKKYVKNAPDNKSRETDINNLEGWEDEE